MVTSQLQSQLFGKNRTFEILEGKGKLPANFTVSHSSEIEVTVWTKVVQVTIPKTLLHKGLSLLISMSDYVGYFALRIQSKAKDIKIKKISEQTYLASSFSSGKKEEYTVRIAYMATCECMLYKCLRNRISEVPHFKKLMFTSEFFPLQITCHHIQAAIESEGAWSLTEFLQTKKQPTKQTIKPAMTNLINPKEAPLGIKIHQHKDFEYNQTYKIYALYSVGRNGRQEFDDELIGTLKIEKSPWEPNKQGLIAACKPQSAARPFHFKSQDEALDFLIQQAKYTMYKLEQTFSQQQTRKTANYQ